MVAKLCIDHPNNNVPKHIAELVGRDLHLQPNHPIGIVRKKIQDYFTTLDTKFEIFNGEVIEQIRHLLSAQKSKRRLRWRDCRRGIIFPAMIVACPNEDWCPLLYFSSCASECLHLALSLGPHCDG